MAKNNVITDHEFYCVNCHNKGISIPRRKGAEREPRHLKKLFCIMQCISITL